MQSANVLLATGTGDRIKCAHNLTQLLENYDEGSKITVKQSNSKKNVEIDRNREPATSSNIQTSLLQRRGSLASRDSCGLLEECNSCDVHGVFDRKKFTLANENLIRRNVVGTSFDFRHALKVDNRENER